MPTCRKCATAFPNNVRINNKLVHAQNRKFCFTCSPFGAHNTKKDDPSAPAKRPRSYAQYPPEMRKKHSREVLLRAHKRKNRLLAVLGPQCSSCGYSKCVKALHFHHADPANKLFGLSGNSLRSKTWEAVLAEGKKCVVLCANCHAEEEARLDDLRMYGAPSSGLEPEA